MLTWLKLFFASAKPEPVEEPVVGQRVDVAIQADKIRHLEARLTLRNTELEKLRTDVNNLLNSTMHTGTKTKAKAKK